MHSIVNHKNTYTQNRENTHTEKVFNKEITIVKADCMQYIAKIIKDELIDMGWSCSIILQDNINKYIEKNNPHHYFLFFIATQITKNVAMYKRYILYQLEQNVNNKLSVNHNKLHESNILKQMYDNAALLIDYCELNVKVTKQYYKNDFKIMNIPARNTTHTESYIESPKENYMYDIIFVGSMNKRRENIIFKLKEKYKVLIVENVYGEELKQLCNQSNICLNIHYYENAILERVRLNEMMEYGIKIISEKPCVEDIDICKYYDSVYFIHIIDNNLDELLNTIENIKDKPNEIHDMNVLSQLFIQDIHKIFNNPVFKQN
jgi:hypothetical protein